MKRFGLSLLIACTAHAVIGAIVASAQQSNSSPSRDEARTQTIVASFGKSKQVTKVRHGVRREKYKEVRSEAVVRSNPQLLSGTYEAPDLGFTLHLRVGADGRVDGNGEERVADGVNRRFELSNAMVVGALLTGTKVYGGGGSEQLEGVFINRTSYDSPNDRGFTVFGLGVVGNPVKLSGFTVDKIFYQLRR